MKRAIVCVALGPALLSLFLFPAARTIAYAQISSGFKDARFPSAYVPSERAAAFQRVLRLGALPRLGPVVSVIPNVPYAADGTRLYFWKPSFVIGTPSGGEAGVNFWGLHTDGHINIEFKAGAYRLYALDCRIVSSNPITYKIFGAAREEPALQGNEMLDQGHLLLMIATPQAGASVLVEMWPSPTTATVGFLGCDLSPVMP